MRAGGSGGGAGSTIVIPMAWELWRNGWMKCLMLAVLGISLAQGVPEAVIHTLPKTEAAKTISLNPEYAVFGEAAGKKKLPLLITLHGAGGTGLDIDRVKRHPTGILRTLEAAGIETLLVCPQAAKSPRQEGERGGWVPADLEVLLAHLLKTLPVDPDRVYLTGTSMGGYGTYAWAAANPEHFAAIAPMVGGLGPLGPKDVTKDLALWGKKLSSLPLRAYYGSEDQVVPPDRGAMILDAIKKAGGGRKAEVIVLEGLGHNAARKPYQDPAFFKWMFAQKRAE